MTAGGMDMSAKNVPGLQGVAESGLSYHQMLRQGMIQPQEDALPVLNLENGQCPCVLHLSCTASFHLCFERALTRARLRLGFRLSKQYMTATLSLRLSKHRRRNCDRLARVMVPISSSGVAHQMEKGSDNENDLIRWHCRLALRREPEIPRLVRPLCWAPSAYDGSSRGRHAPCPQGRHEPSSGGDEFDWIHRWCR